jgi:hypothetical protein
MSNDSQRDNMVADLLSHDAGMDCVVSFPKRPLADIDQATLLDELHGTQALILLVTADMLALWKDGSPPPEYMPARENGVPILPVVSDVRLFPVLTELAGAIHGVAMTDAEYRTKLHRQLESLLATEALIREVAEKAFTANLFLSYRKKDLAAARRFMQAFHDIEEFQTIAIWYDNFLTAGRIFDEEIRGSIRRSDAFVLLVTPHLQEPGNYVLTQEYPYATSLDKTIIAVEGEPTDRADFLNKYPTVGNYTVLKEQRDAFRAVLAPNAFVRNPDPERSYLLGMAFLKGILVERSIRHAIELLVASAEDATTASIRAAIQLSDLYENGISMDVDYEEALRWRARAVEISKETNGIDHPETANAFGARRPREWDDSYRPFYQLPFGISLYCCEKLYTVARASRAYGKGVSG